MPRRRWRRFVRTLIGLAAAFAARPAAAVDWGEGCLPFLPAAEDYYHLPKGLLKAVALTESGQNGAPYPWALNIAGQAVIARDYRTAAALLRGPDGRPRRDVAVGCMQIHMQYHLDRFGAPEWALHPRYNVWFAALYLDSLRRQYGNIVAAIAHYHASDPVAQRAYLCRVAHHLAGTAAETRHAIGLDHCAERPVGAERVGDGNRADDGAGTPERHRAAVMAARRVGRIIVLGAERR